MTAYTIDQLANCWPGDRLPHALELEQFDALEVHPQADVSPADEEGTWYEACDPVDAEIWSIQLHHIEGGCDNLTDCETKAEAIAIVNHLSKLWSLPINHMF